MCQPARPLARGPPNFRAPLPTDLRTIPASGVSSLAPSATTNTTNASNITSGSLALRRVAPIASNTGLEDISRRMGLVETQLGGLSGQVHGLREAMIPLQDHSMPQHAAVNPKPRGAQDTQWNQDARIVVQPSGLGMN